MKLVKAAAASVTSIILPLYQYPPSPTACWPAVTAALQATNGTSTPWIIIVNPDSGPSTDTTDLYLRCLPTLRQPGVSLVGYVATGYGDRSSKTVQRQIQTYQKWKNLKVTPPGAAVKTKGKRDEPEDESGDDVGDDNGGGADDGPTSTGPQTAGPSSGGGKKGGKGGGKKGAAKTTLQLDGIFFDEVSSDASDLKTYKKYASWARGGGWKSGKGKVVFNPGTTPASGYFALADITVTYEDVYSKYSYSAVPSSAPKSKQGVIIYSYPAGSTQSDYQTTLAPLIPPASSGQRTGAVYITTDTLPNPYDPSAADPGLVQSVVALNNVA